MEAGLSRCWSMLMMRGLFAILFGLITVGYPIAVLETLITLFGAFALVDGIMAILVSRRAKKAHAAWAAMLPRGVAGVVLGLAVMFWPGLTSLSLMYWIATWAVAAGALEIKAARELRAVLKGEWLLLLAGAMSVLFGLALFFKPAAGAMAVISTLGLLMVFVGIAVTGVALKLRRGAKAAPQP
ncbi:MAG: DUF308 domain-containing protein [Gemmatimonadota bacterium]